MPLNPFSKEAKAKRAAERLQRQQQQQSRASTFLQTPSIPVQRSYSNPSRSSYNPSHNGATPGSRRSSASSRSSLRKVPFSNNGGTGYGDVNALPPPPAYSAAVTPNLQNAIQANLYAGPSPPSSGRNSGDQKTGFFNRALTKKQSHETLRRMQSGDGQLTAYNMFHQLKKNVLDKNLKRFYDDSALNLHVRKLFKDRSCQNLKKSWKLTDEESSESAILSLWDVWLLIDDSGSMDYYPERKEHLVDYVSRITPALTYFDRDGIDLYFMNNTDKDCKEQTDQQVVADLIENVECTGVTPLGNTLKRMIDPIKKSIAHGRHLKKPIQILIITDGEPQGDGPRQDLRGKDAQRNIEQYIADTMRWFERHGYSKYTITYQFAQVGNDQKVEDWFKELDNHPIIGDIIDCTSRFEAESKQAGGLKLYQYLLKLLLGAIGDRDKVDER